MASAFGWTKVVPLSALSPVRPTARREIQLCEGDKLLLFTDGVTEARDVSGEEFGEHRLQQCLRSYRGSNAAELRTRILNEVAEFCADDFEDDATLMVVLLT